MKTYCNIYKLKKDRIADYIKCHDEMWDGQVRALTECGAEDMEIYLWNEYCIITYALRDIDFGQYIDNLSNNGENRKWQTVVDGMFEEQPVFEGESKLCPLEKIFSLRSRYEAVSSKDEPCSDKQ